jgi:hypothetical protein
LNKSAFLEIYKSDPPLKEAYKIGSMAELYVYSKNESGNLNLVYDKNFSNILISPMTWSDSSFLAD